MEAMEILGIVFLLLGLVLVGIEMTLPGFGFFGISGIISLVLSVLFLADDIQSGIVLAIVIIVILCVMLAVSIAILGKRQKGPFVLEEDVKGKDGFLGPEDLEYLIGKEGSAVTDLRPSGKGNFDGIEFDIYSEGKYIEKGSPIRIIRIKDNRIMVSPR